MASSTPHTILLRGTPESDEALAKASEAIKPGMLLQRHTDGTFKKHATAGVQTAPLIAREADIYGRGIDDAYADGETVLSWHGKKGERFYMFLKTGNNVAIDAVLQSAGDGTLQAATAGSQLTTGNYTYTPAGIGLFKALEAVNNASGNPVRIRVEVM